MSDWRWGSVPGLRFVPVRSSTAVRARVPVTSSSLIPPSGRRDPSWSEVAMARQQSLDEVLDLWTAGDDVGKRF